MGNDRSETGNLKRGEEDGDDPHRPVLVGNELCNCDCEGYLDGTGKPTEEFAGDQVIDAFGSSSDDCTDQSERIADDEEPASSKDVRQSSDDQESDTEAQGVGERDPGDVVGWTDRSINQGQRVGRQNPSQVI